MGKMKKIDLFRWIALGPVVFIASAFTFFMGAMFFEAFLHLRIPKDGVLVIGVVSAFTVTVWLVLSYIIAPKNKLKTIWISYGLGVLLVVLISVFVIGEGGSRSKISETIGSLVVSSIVTGAFVAMVLQVFSKSSITDFLSNLDKYITTSS